MSRTLAEQETTVRWDEEEGMLWLGTTSVKTLRAWERIGVPYVVHGTVRGEAASWEAKVPITRRFPWRALLPAKPKVLTDQQRAVLSRNARRARTSEDEMGSGKGNVPPGDDTGA